uniref:proton-translocating NAD(P)(+) transhydrogenase n=1 Tax=Alcaligenes sp. NyZ215 TaxID=441452 RepID=A7KS57_9BURK|nr:putative transposase [Alcaligenes sp. NyZ215]
MKRVDQVGIWFGFNLIVALARLAEGRREKATAAQDILVNANHAPIRAVLTVANRDDVTQSLPLIDAIPPICGVRGRQPRKPAIIYPDLDYGSEAYRQGLRERRIKSVSATFRMGCCGLGKFRWVVERTRDWLYNFCHYQIRFEDRADVLEAFLKQAATTAGTRYLEPCGTRVAWLHVPYASINSDRADVALGTGATCILNHPALEVPGDGTPGVDAWKAQTVLISKRDISVGHPSEANPWHYIGKMRMQFGDAKQNIDALLRQLEAYGFSK